jgi:replication factor C subunit 3/5
MYLKLKIFNNIMINYDNNNEFDNDDIKLLNNNKIDISLPNYLPWVEKYRPTNIEQIISHDQNITTIKKLLSNNCLPHLLFYGSPGTGKTSTILSIAKHIYGNNIKLMVMKLDASDDRGINTVREDIKGFADKLNIFQKGVRLIILDEVDSMTFDAQFALRRIIEKYSSTLRFCLICNYENKIIPAIRSRCTNFRFSNIKNKHIFEKLKGISINEKLFYKDDILNTISILAKGDLRKGINLLQSISMNKINLIPTINNCYEIACVPSPNEINIILDLLLNNDNIIYIYNIINNIIITNTYSLLIILKELTLVLLDKYIDYPNIIIIISELSDLENVVTKSTFCDIYISGLISIFIKNKIKKN